jgi:hypothetical protein
MILAFRFACWRTQEFFLIALSTQNPMILWPVIFGFCSVFFSIITAFCFSGYSDILQNSVSKVARCNFQQLFVLLLYPVFLFCGSTLCILILVRILYRTCKGIKIPTPNVEHFFYSISPCLSYFSALRFLHWRHQNIFLIALLSRNPILRPPIMFRSLFRAWLFNVAGHC